MVLSDEAMTTSKAEIICPEPHVYAGQRRANDCVDGIAISSIETPKTKGNKLIQTHNKPVCKSDAYSQEMMSSKLKAILFWFMAINTHALA